MSENEYKHNRSAPEAVNHVAIKVPKNALPGVCKQRAVLLDTGHSDKHRMDEQASAEQKVAVFCCCPGHPPSDKTSAPPICTEIDAC